MNAQTLAVRISIAVLCAVLASTADATIITFAGHANGLDVESTATPFANLSGGITTTGPNLGAAIFDSSDSGPNVGGPDPDLLVNLGRILILQSTDNPGKTGNIWNVPDDEADGGTFFFNWDSPVHMTSIDLIDIDDNGPVIVTLVDAANRTRTYSVPLDWTYDIDVNGSADGYDTLDLTTLAAQNGEGPGGNATASQQAGFDANNVVLLTVEFKGSAGLDNINFRIVPAPSALLVMLAGLPLANRRRRRSGTSPNAERTEPVRTQTFATRTLTSKHAAAVLGAALATTAISSAQAASVFASNFDQIARVNTLGGTAMQVGGGPLLNATQFTGPVNATSGVNITLPGWAFLTTVNSFSDTGASEPGNISSVILGAPTDMTFTLPGPGGPDGTIGDGSLHFTPGDVLIASFASAITTRSGVNTDVFIITNTAGGGKVDIKFYNGNTQVDQILKVTIPGGTVGTGIGGVLLNMSSGITFNKIKITGVSGGTGSVEIDAIAVIVPGPGSLALLMVAALGLRPRRRRAA